MHLELVQYVAVAFSDDVIKGFKSFHFFLIENFHHNSYHLHGACRLMQAIWVDLLFCNFSWQISQIISFGYDSIFDVIHTFFGIFLLSMLIIRHGDVFLD